MFIQAETLRKAGQKERAIKTYRTLMKEYFYGQCWDPRGWFWKPAEVAEDWVFIMESNLNIDFGDYSSQFLTNP